MTHLEGFYVSAAEQLKAPLSAISSSLSLWSINHSAVLQSFTVRGFPLKSCPGHAPYLRFIEAGSQQVHVAPPRFMLKSHQEPFKVYVSPG